jgi:hypothetical protein
MYPLYLEKQTKDILKLNSVSNTTIRDVAKHLTFGVGMSLDYMCNYNNYNKTFCD